MYSLNRVQLLGHLTETPQLRQLPNGTAVSDLNIKTVSRVRKEDGTTVFLSSYHTVTAWRRLAEIVCDFCRAGSQVYVAGRVKTENWEGENGQKRYKTKVIAEDIILLDSKKEMEQLSENSPVAGGLNQAEALGNLTRAPEIRQTTTGQQVVNLSIATNRRWQDRVSGEQKEETEFHSVVAWGELANEIGDKMKSGDKAFVRGRLQTRSWDTPDGEKRYATEIVADQVLLLGARNEELAAGEGQPRAAAGEPRESAAMASAAVASSHDGIDSDPIPDLPEIKYESDIKPEDLPF